MPSIGFSVLKMKWWHRNTVWMSSKTTDGGWLVEPIISFWSWDKADDFAEMLNGIVRRSTQNETGEQPKRQVE